MGSRILHELSQELVALLEDGLDVGGERQIPVHFCHPLDSFADQHDPEDTFGVLYMTRIVPEPNLRQSGLQGGSVLDDTIQPRLSRPPLWVSARYVFLVAGGDAKQQLVALAAALQTVHDHPSLRVPRTDEPDRSPEELPGEEGDAAVLGEVVCPLRLVGEGEGWRELGLHEHRLTLVFEAMCPLPAAPLDPVERIQERGLIIEEGAL